MRKDKSLYLTPQVVILEVSPTAILQGSIRQEDENKVVVDPDIPDDDDVEF